MPHVVERHVCSPIDLCTRAVRVTGRELAREMQIAPRKPSLNSPMARRVPTGVEDRDDIQDSVSFVDGLRHKLEKRADRA
ncbi:MAG: hypothetical protein HY815_24010 [Candidatus Riflebacteria bacterium]|nr:hypothetical protein [Candidatus Riflebacteria bacterium]